MGDFVRPRDQDTMGYETEDKVFDLIGLSKPIQQAVDRCGRIVHRFAPNPGVGLKVDPQGQVGWDFWNLWPEVCSQLTESLLDGRQAGLRNREADEAQRVPETPLRKFR